MMEIIKTAIGVALGSLLGAAAMLGLCFNKKFLKWYTKHLLTVTTEISAELIEEDEELV